MSASVARSLTWVTRRPWTAGARRPWTCSVASTSWSTTQESRDRRRTSRTSRWTTGVSAWPIDLDSHFLTCRAVVPRLKAAAERVDHQHVVDGRSGRLRPADAVRGGQVGGDRPHEVAGDRARTLRSHGQRHLPRLGAGRADGPGDRGRGGQPGCHPATSSSASTPAHSRSPASSTPRRSPTWRVPWVAAGPHGQRTGHRGRRPHRDLPPLRASRACPMRGWWT